MTPDSNSIHKIWTDLVSIKTKETLSSYSELASVTRQGLTVKSKKEFFCVSESDFPRFLNSPVELFLSQYEIPFYGVIKHIRKIGKNIFEVSIRFTKDTPSYYRECVTDLMKDSLPA